MLDFNAAAAGASVSGVIFNAVDYSKWIPGCHTHNSRELVK